MNADEIAESGGSSIELWLSDGEAHVEEVALQRRVWEELGEDARLATLDLRVEVVAGVAMLDGTVPRPDLRAAVERAARRVKGLRGVENHIAVGAP
jgi:osmotically-inducible protein OsmY